MPDPTGDPVIRQSITVPLLPMAAFTLWTEGIHTWWPTSHSRSGDPATRVAMELGVGGRFFERASDATEYEWGQIVIWDPPHHLAYDWYLGSGPTTPTRVDVYFVAIDSQQTRIDIEHRGPELIGNLWWLNNARYRGAWDVVLPTYGQAAATLSPV